MSWRYPPIPWFGRRSRRGGPRSEPPLVPLRAGFQVTPVGAPALHQGEATDDPADPLQPQPPPTPPTPSSQPQLPPNSTGWPALWRTVISVGGSNRLSSPSRAGPPPPPIPRRSAGPI